MRPVAKVVIRAGLVPDEMLAQLAKWGVPLEHVSDKETLSDMNDIVEQLQSALDSKDQAQFCESDLDLIREYIDPTKQRQGTLFIRQGNKKDRVKVTFCITSLHKYAIPWMDETNLDDYLDEIRLRYKEKGEIVEVRLSDVREVHFGAHKAFIVCSGEGS